MTDRPDPAAAHLGLDTLGDLDEGLLSPADADAAREHLAGCDRCQDDRAALASVRDLLAGEREIAMPDDVADRIFGALTAQPPLSEDDRPALEPLRASVTTLPLQRPSRPYVKPVLIALTAAAGIALVSVGIINLPSSRESTAASAGAAPTTQPVVLSNSGRAYTSTGLGPQALALLPGHTTAATAAAAAGTSGAAPAATSAAAGISAAAAATEGSAASSAPSAAGAAAPSPAGTTAAAAPQAPGADTTTTLPASPLPVTPTADVLAALRQGGAAQSCLESFEPHSGAPLAIDIGTFNGKPAIIGVFQDPGNSARLQVVAVGPPGCSLYSFAQVAGP